MYKQPTRNNRRKEYINPKDDKNFIFGSIWKIKDELIKIPNADRVHQRKYHFSRCVVIVDNSKNNFNENSLLISVVPLSSRIDCEREFDIELDKEEDGVLKDSIIMLDYIQPVLKKDLHECVGEISLDKKYELIEMCMTKMGINTEKLIASDSNKEKNKNKKMF